MAKVRKVAIVGKGPGRGLAPNVGEVWGVNNVWMGQYVSMIVDIHNLDWTVEERFEHYSHLRDILPEEELWERSRLGYEQSQKAKEHSKLHQIPILSQKVYDGCPGIEFPLRKIVEKFDCDLFTSVVPYAIAYAVYRAYKQIDLFGVNCDLGAEWEYQRESVLCWLGIAKGRGIKVTVTGSATRPFRAYDRRLYGYNIPQEAKGLLDRDGILDMVTGKREEFDIWREY